MYTDCPLQLIEIAAEHIRQPPYLCLSGVAVNTENPDEVFDITAHQYVSFYKSQPHLSLLPVRACFNERRYRNQKPIPSNNACVSVGGFITSVEVDKESGQPSFFHVCVDSMNFPNRKRGRDSDSVQSM